MRSGYLFIPALYYELLQPEMVVGITVTVMLSTTVESTFGGPKAGVLMSLDRRIDNTIPQAFDAVAGDHEFRTESAGIRPETSASGARCICSKRPLAGLCFLSSVLQP
jgi:hypothetical protein